MTSKISSTSFKNMTSLVLLVLGQYLSNPRTTYVKCQSARSLAMMEVPESITSSVNAASFSRN